MYHIPLSDIALGQTYGHANPIPLQMELVWSIWNVNAIKPQAKKLHHLLHIIEDGIFRGITPNIHRDTLLQRLNVMEPKWRH